MNSVVAYNSFLKMAELKELPKHGDFLARYGLDADSPVEKVASVMARLSDDDADDLWQDACLSYAFKYAADIAEEIRPYAERWSSGFVKKCEAVGADPRKVLEKHAEFMEKQAVDWGNVAGQAANIGSYMIPGVGTVRLGYDALKDFGGMFGKGLNWKQRLGKGISGLANTAFAAMSVIPGMGAMGAGAKWLGQGAKWLSKAPKIGQLVKATKLTKHLGRASNALTGTAQNLAGGLAARLPTTGIGGKLSNLAFGEGAKGLQAAAKGTGVKDFAGAVGTGKLNLGLMGATMGGGLLAGEGPEEAAMQAAGPAAMQMGYGGGVGNVLGMAPDYGGAGFGGSYGGGSGMGFRGSSFGGGVQPLSRFSAGGRF